MKILTYWKLEFYLNIMKLGKNRIHLFIMLFAVSSLLVHIPSDAYGANGDVDSTVVINDSTVNGPTLTNRDIFGASVAKIGRAHV